MDPATIAFCTAVLAAGAPKIENKSETAKVIPDVVNPIAAPLLNSSADWEVPPQRENTTASKDNEPAAIEDIALNRPAAASLETSVDERLGIREEIRREHPGTKPQNQEIK